MDETWGGCEECDGRDDDGDGATDEGFACTEGQSWECLTSCASLSVRVCEGCWWSACLPVETCDDEDDDCDGQTDEGFECMLGSSEPCTTTCGSEGIRVCEGCAWEECETFGEFCDDGEDNDCDGETDEGCGECAPDAVEACGSDVGECVAGTRTCDATARWGVCSDVGPATDECNGLDDDCDGETDEDFGVGLPCDGPDPDQCSEGVTTCGGCTDATGDSQDECNGLDDDCDGMTDEDFVTGTPCDGPDADLCVEGVTTCLGCDDTTSDSPEQCNGLDDDCDGTSDEGCSCAPGAAQPCGTDEGECTVGTQSCQPDLTWGPCDGVGPATEECDDEDDDCDGETDEGFGLGMACDGADSDACAEGVLTCDGCDDLTGNAAESCNGLDDDCDGVTDDDFGCSPASTEACTTPCGPGSRTCAGDCTWGTCVALPTTGSPGAPDSAGNTLAFEPNAGQWDARVRYVVRGGGATTFLTDTEAVFRFRGAVLRMRYGGAKARPTGEDELVTKVSYFLGNDPKKWRTNVPTYGRVVYRDVYPGIDLAWNGAGKRLEYRFVVAPGADPSRIRLSFSGAERLEVKDGDLVAHTAAGPVRWARLLLYQEDEDGTLNVVPGAFAAQDAEVRFQVGAYDPARALVIDPTLVYSTLLGGTNNDPFYENVGGIGVDACGRAYVAGETDAVDFPTTAGANDPSFNGSVPGDGGGGDMYVAKLDANGSDLLWATYLGGSSGDGASGLAVDASGHAYVTGRSGSTDFPTTPGAFDTIGDVEVDAVVAKLSPDGAALVYSTFLGGSSWDKDTAIAVDESGRAVITGRTTSDDFPTTPGAFDTTLDGGPIFGTDAFVTKLDALGEALVFSTFLGGRDEDEGHGVAAGDAGSVVVAGYTRSTDFPTTPGAFDRKRGGTGPCASSGSGLFDCYDGFVTKFYASGALAYSTFLGGAWLDSANAVALGTSGTIYVGGSTSSSDFPTTSGAYDTICAEDQFAAALDPTMAGDAGLLWSTCVGGTAGDRGSGVGLTATGAVVLVGSAGSDFPVTAGTFGGVYDASLSVLSGDGTSLIYATFLGGSGEERGRCLAVDPAGDAYVAGDTWSADYPTTSGAFDTSLDGPTDTFVAKFDL